jgi:hypothetical protein
MTEQTDKTTALAVADDETTIDCDLIDEAILQVGPDCDVIDEIALQLQGAATPQESRDQQEDLDEGQSR